MIKSYDKINYSIRPAKCIERKMLCEVFRMLSPFGEVKKYRYVGFGSPFFTDFYFFHKNLGITNMISIEKNEEDRKRFEFNNPFSCIEIRYGNSKDILPSLKWDIRTILWLDYDSTLTNNTLDDIKFSFSSAEVGSVIFMTVDGMVRDDHNEKIAKGERLQQLKSNVGKLKVPRDISEDFNLHGWETAKTFKKIIDNEIEETISFRNGGRSQGNKLIYKQLFNFNYDDGTRMLTTGGLLCDEGTLANFEQCDLSKLTFISESDEPYLIEAPKLTLREIKALDQYLPSRYHESPSFIPDEQKKMYEKIYNYFPHFSETEL